MRLRELPRILAERGVRLDVRLVVDAPKGVVDPELRDMLATHRPMFVQAIARADAMLSDPSQWERFMFLDDHGFDWSKGEQTR